MSIALRYTFVSDGGDDRLPAGQYLVTVWLGAGAELAWRPQPDRSIVWSPPAMGELAS